MNKDIFYKKETVYKKAGSAVVEAAYAYAEGYKKFLDAAKPWALDGQSRFLLHLADDGGGDVAEGEAGGFYDEHFTLLIPQR